MTKCIFALAYTRLIPLVMCVFLGCVPMAYAQVDVPGFGSKVPETGNDLVQVSALCDESAIVPGEESTLAVRFQIHPGWHIYWKKAGDTGAPTELSISAPAGVVPGKVKWPRPKVFRSDGDASFGYSEETMLFVPFTVPKEFKGDTISITINAAWLVCKRSCLFGQRQWTVELPIAKPGEVITRQRDLPNSNTAQYMKMLPKPISQELGVRAQVVPGKNGPHGMLRIEGPAIPNTQVLFMPEHTPGVRYQGQVPFTSRFVAGSFLIEVPLEVVPGDALGKPLRAAGLIGLGSGQSSPSLECSVKISPVEPGNKKSISN